eukprot:1338770-Karenia_brevis.AAC.1
MIPTADMIGHFRVRQDRQIMGLELLAISMALSTFAPWLVHKRIVLHSDNSGAEVSFRRGTARKYDHTQLVHQQWLKVTQLGAAVYVKRVATQDNLADLPSRGVRLELRVLKLIQGRE